MLVVLVNSGGGAYFQGTDVVEWDVARRGSLCGGPKNIANENLAPVSRISLMWLAQNTPPRPDW